MNGIILVNKPKNISSNTVVNIVKKSVGAKKAGHLGTLDVAGEGLRPVTINKATKLFDYFLNKDKEYLSVFKFGETTNTLDLEGEITATDNKIITLKDIENVLNKHNETFFKGITWTTDAIYRETPMRIQARKNDGAVCAEMETASLSAVAKKRNVKYACLLYFSDYNNGKEWTTRFYNKFELRERILNYSIEAILSL